MKEKSESVVYLCAACHSRHGPDGILTIGVLRPFRCDVCGIQYAAGEAHPNWERDVRATTPTYRGGSPRSTERSGAQERCTFHDDHDPVTDRPRGRRCERDAVEELEWMDGRTSVACEDHGVKALDEDARLLVAAVRSLGSTEEGTHR